MDKSVMLWVDLRTADSHSLKPLYERHFVVRVIGEPESSLLDETRSPPSVICFDFDYPDRGGLDLLRETRCRHPSLPIIMLTEQHSESLAIWALRLRVWDLILKPADADLINRQIHNLMTQLKHNLGWEETCQLPGNVPQMPIESRYYGKPQNRGIRPALTYIQQHLADKISEEEVASLCNMRPIQFSRNFKKAYNCTFQEYVQKSRMDEAARLLETPNMPILEIAMAVGFKDQSYFSRVFRKHFGMTPKTYREDHQVSEDDSELAPLSLFEADLQD
ncbi:helix-turn-helix transcriptional regulator [Marinobacterium arenosum]|uniref:helix-turn-helix transcriptional regulator n=1 Tax=Marinobacterium arenosum TaxID=2862496 RepID=UPI001C971FD5|nr:helix-turn-helix domain-containing protein [Marinobacterium arenosum]MBY4675729.1 helix-turn-helix domain-containing protein [Marinobacterium arenosum]